MSPESHAVYRNATRFARLLHLRASPPPRLLFLVGTSLTRWFVTPTADSQSRYVYVVAALLLPALALGIDACLRRWRLVAPFVGCALLVAIVKNATEFNAAPFDARYFRNEKQLVLAMGRTPAAAEAPGYLRPSPWYTIGWLRQVADSGGLPPAGPVAPVLDAHVRFILSIAQLDERFAGLVCRSYGNGTVLEPSRGDRVEVRFGARPEVGANYFVQDSVVVTLLGPSERPVDSLVFKTDFGRVLEFEQTGVKLRVSAADPHQPLVLCSRSG